jgi:hypothetical protein
MRTLTDDEVREWVDSHVAFERWLRAVHAERAAEARPTGGVGAPAGDHDDRVGQPKQSGRTLRGMIGWASRALRRRGSVAAPRPIDFGTADDDREAQDPQRAA